MNASTVIINHLYYAHLLYYYILLWYKGQAFGAAVGGYPDLSSLQTRASLLYDWEVRYEQVVLFPDVAFTCPQGGTIASLTFVAMPGADSEEGQDPELQVWRTDAGGRRYTRMDSTAVSTTGSSASISRHVYSLSPTGLAFQEGDMLGLFQPAESDSTTDLYVQSGGGSINYHRVGTSSPIASILFDDRLNGTNDYLLVQVTTGLCSKVPVY